MTVRHQLKDTDTVEYLSNLYFGTPDRWREIVDYNNLIYPYLSRNPSDKFQVYADGFIRVNRAETRQPLTIQKHWTIKTRKNVMSSTFKTYYVVNDVTIPAGESEALVFIRSLVPGTQGNTSAGSITELGDDFTRNSVNVNITNDNQVTGGKEGFVRVTGEYVFIPNEEDSQLLTDYDATFSYDQIRYFYGEDLAIGTDSDLVVGSNQDLATVNFIDNVKQAVNRRFETEIGDILTDFTFGNTIAEIIGDNKLPTEAKKRLITLEIINCLSYEDRISDPVVEDVTLVPADRACYATISMKIVKLGTDIKMENILLGGMANV